jgi:hypothetical protein
MGFAEVLQLRILQLAADSTLTGMPIRWPLHRLQLFAMRMQTVRASRQVAPDLQHFGRPTSDLSATLWALVLKLASSVGERQHQPAQLHRLQLPIWATMILIVVGTTRQAAVVAMITADGSVILVQAALQQFRRHQAHPSGHAYRQELRIKTPFQAILDRFSTSPSAAIKMQLPPQNQPASQL